MDRLRVSLTLVIVLASLSAFVGLAFSIAGPYIAADALEEAIRGAQTPDEVRSRIANYYSSVWINRVLLLGGPGLAAAILAALSIRELHERTK